MTTDELRERFLQFFASKRHKIYPSDSLVPKDDPTLLFTSAGMNQFKQEFLGKTTKFCRRATCQKCLRTDDLDKVGKTNSHHTFFEMLGNFSFGDYFKDEAISWAWEFVTGELALPQERLWVSVYQEDEKAYQIWQDKIEIPKDRIVKLGPEDNFWPANAPEDGPDGPCGPCSEIFYDLGKDIGCQRSDCNPSCSCGRFVETWNLVFTQFQRKGKNNLEPLPKKNIDTGMGLERMAALLQGVTNNFEIDIFAPITKEIMRLSPKAADKLSPSQLSARNAIADHIRAISFAIADGVMPANDQRGYVVRKLIRRAVWHGRGMGIEKPFLYKLVPSVAKVMKRPYPELDEKRENTAQVVLAEERRFRQTLERAVVFAEELIARLKTEGKTQLPAEAAFKLYDTYGLPLEMLNILMQAKDFKLDEPGFHRELQLAREISRNASNIEDSVFVGTLDSKYKLKPTKFVGQKKYQAKATVQALFKDDHLVKAVKSPEKIKIVLDQTPFYGESGGQVGDTGVMSNEGLEVQILDTQKVGQTTVHLGKIVKGTLKVNIEVEAKVDTQRRKDIACNHTATHLLQAALRQVLGEHLRQAGSWVGADRLRFDFTHFQALNQAQLCRVEEIVNEQINKNIKTDVLEMGFDRAQKMGALAFFGEKYQAKVKVMKIGDFSQELCAGTHVTSTAEIGMFKIISESSVASGIRRIEAVTARKAEAFLQQREFQLKQLAQTIGCAQDELPECVERLLARVKQLNKVLESARLAEFKSQIEKLKAQAKEICGIKIITQKVENADMHVLRLMADLLTQKLDSACVVLGSAWEDRACLVCAIKSELPLPGLDAAQIIRSVAKDVDGSGGGRADFAQAGGSNVSGINQALIKADAIIRGLLSHQK